jgi:uncharacterized RDD family membrane protein YckC
VTTAEEAPLAARQGSSAGLFTRGLAGAVDAAVVLILLVVGYLALSAVLFMFRPRTFSFPEPGRYWSMSLGVVAAMVYLAFGWYISGRTPGKQLAGLRVVASSGDSLSLLVALARAVLCVLFPIGLLWSAFSAKNASVQDLLLRTSVIYDWRKHTM